MIIQLRPRKARPALYPTRKGKPEVRIPAPRALLSALSLSALAMLCPVAYSHVLNSVENVARAQTAEVLRRPPAPPQPLQVVTMEDYRRGLQNVPELYEGQAAVADIWVLPHQLADDPESLDAVRDDEFLLRLVAGFFGERPRYGDDSAEDLAPPEVEDFSSPPRAGSDPAPSRAAALSFVAVGAAALGAGTLLRRRT